MNLITSTTDFEVNGFPVDGFPILINEQGDIHMAVLNFFIYHCIQRGRAKSKGTWMKYGQDLYDYFSFVESHSLDWRDVHRNPSLLATYRDWSIEHFGLQPSTINHRLNILIKFYEYSFKQQWTDGFPYALERIKINKKEHFLIHGDRTHDKVSHDVKLKIPRKGIKIITRSEQKKLLNCITNPTHKLWTWLALATGLRKEELNTLPLKYVINPAKGPNQTYFRITLNPMEMSTKGDVERFIDVPRSVMLGLWDYVHTERFERIKTHDNEYCKNAMGEPVLFINYKGKPLSPNADTMRLEYVKLGLPFHVTPHMLRHTYATNTLKELAGLSKRNFNSLVYVRDRLGHSSISTTQKYLHFLEYLEDEFALEYHQQLAQYVT